MRKALTLAEVLAGRGTMLPVFSKAGFTLAEYDTHVAQNDDHLVILNSIQSLLRNRFRIFWLLRTCAYRLTQLASSLVRFVRSGMTINNNVILSRSEGSHNIEILRSLCSLRMTWGKGVNVFSLSKGEGQGEGFITNLRKELINLSTYPLINFKSAFTLAEVLITLGIIGVVAAMTIPNLIQKNYEHQTVAKLKETYSILSQAIRMASEEYGEPSGWDIFGASEETAIKFMNNIKPFIKIATDCGTYDEEGKCMTKGPIYHMNKKTIWSNSYSKSRTYYKFCLMNGSCLWFRTANQGEYVGHEGYMGTFFIDTNGSKQPNAFGWDVFNFTIQNDVLIPEGCDKNFNDYKISCKDKNSVGNGCACYINLNNNMNYLHTK